MREIPVSLVKETVKSLFIEANYQLNTDIREALQKARDNEQPGIPSDILQTLCDNYIEAEKGIWPLCQDTGTSVVFLEIGQEIHFTEGFLIDAVQQGVAEAYTNAFLRKSIVSDPLFNRKNTGNNCPAFIHTQIIEGDKLSVTVLPKGGGSENMSRIRMLKPADGVEGVVGFVKECVLQAGGNPCPPIIIGIGIGANFETSALLAKKSLLRDLQEHHQDEHYAHLEKTILNEINQLNIGPMGLGGKTTALAVHIETAPCHIASLPVAVNIECHAHRYKKAVL